MSGLQWERVQAGRYRSIGGAYVIARSVEGVQGEWRVTVTAAPTSTPIKRRTLAEAKAAAQEHATPPEATVPQAWVDQLVTLLDSGVRIVKSGEGWQNSPVLAASRIDPERLSAAATEAIRRGIARELPPTPGQGVIRLALTDSFRTERAALDVERLKTMTGAPVIEARHVPPGEWDPTGLIRSREA